MMGSEGQNRSLSVRTGKGSGRFSEGQNGGDDNKPKDPCGGGGGDGKDTLFADLELMKEKYSKLLLGEDMSGGGKGVSSALALSNAITNLAGTISLFQHWKLQLLFKL